MSSPTLASFYSSFPGCSSSYSTCCFSIPFVPRFLEKQIFILYTLISQWKVGNLFPFISKFLSVPLHNILLSAESLICWLDCRVIARNVQSCRCYKILFLSWITQMRKNKKKKKLCDKIENDNQTDFRNSPTAFIKQ